MTKAMRIEYAGATHHVMARRDHGRPIFEDECRHGGAVAAGNNDDMAVDGKPPGDGPLSPRRERRHKTRTKQINQRDISLVLSDPFL